MCKPRRWFLACDECSKEYSRIDEELSPLDPEPGFGELLAWPLVFVVLFVVLAVFG